MLYLDTRFVKALSIRPADALLLVLVSYHTMVHKTSNSTGHDTYLSVIAFLGFDLRHHLSKVYMLACCHFNSLRHAFY
jgi:hypothetical protein